MPDSNITKNALAASMKKLMAQRPFAKTSVGDICDDCGRNKKAAASRNRAAVYYEKTGALCSAQLSGERSRRKAQSGNSPGS